jgi:hypothetical protein
MYDFILRDTANKKRFLGRRIIIRGLLGLFRSKRNFFIAFLDGRVNIFFKAHHNLFIVFQEILIKNSTFLYQEIISYHFIKSCFVVISY